MLSHPQKLKAHPHGGRLPNNSMAVVCFLNMHSRSLLSMFPAEPGADTSGSLFKSQGLKGWVEGGVEAKIVSVVKTRAD